MSAMSAKMPSGRRTADPRGGTNWQQDLREPMRVRRPGQPGQPRQREQGRANFLQVVLPHLPLPSRGKGVGGVGQGGVGLRGWIRAAAVAWLLLAVYAYVVAPHSALALACFFALLYVALAATLVPLCRLVGRQLMPWPLRAQIPFGHALRQGLLLALLAAGNLALLAGRAWSPAALAVALIAFGIEEAITLARK